MTGNPIRMTQDGYWIHEFDGREYDSIWLWADALLEKYGFDYDDAGPMVTVTFRGRRFCFHNHDTWDDFYMGMVTVCETMWRDDQNVTSTGTLTSGSNQMRKVRMVIA